MKKALQSLVLLLAALMVPATATATGYVRGDVNGDGIVGMDDLTALINYLVYGNGINMTGADADLSGGVGMDDLTALINYLVFGVWPGNSHEWVDLGLPSGTLWATCNVGADSPEDYGDYFAWGETETKEVHYLSTYKWCNGSRTTMTKYCTSSSYGYNGFVDNKTELDLEDDAAYVNWGASWRMPNEEQQVELIENCIKTWTTRNGVNGYLFTGPNGNTLFLPAAGYRYDSSLYDAGSYGYYWSRTLNSDYPFKAYNVFFLSEVVYLSDNNRDNGFAVRPVRVLQN